MPHEDRITLRRLADMTSGVASYTRSQKFIDRFFAHPETVFTPKQILATGLELSLFEPGAQFDYSSTDTVLLGCATPDAPVTGAPVEEASSSASESRTNSDIASGACEESPTLTDDPPDIVCSSPATRITVALSITLGHTLTPPPAR